MPRLTVRRIPRLLELFLVATLLPAAALAWLGWRLIEQDREPRRLRRASGVLRRARSGAARFCRRGGSRARPLEPARENAAKYSPDESAIVVRLEEDDGRVAIRVSDQGAGIPAAEQPFIFDQFFRGAAATQSAVKGTGVGLAVVRHIILGHGGDVRLDSTVGVGSTFSIRLPAAPHESASEPERRVS